MAGLSLALAFWRLKPTQHPGNQYVAALILLSTLSLGAFGLQEQLSENRLLVLVLSVVSTSIFFLYGVVLYWYTQQIVSGNRPIRLSGWHLLPKAIHGLILITILIWGREWVPFWLIEALAIVHVGIYTILSIRLLRRQPQPADKVRLPRNQPVHLQVILWAKLVCSIGWGSLFVGRLLVPASPLIGYGYLVIWSIPLLIVYLLAYFAIVQPEYFKTVKATGKYKNFKLNTQESTVLFETLKQVMQEKQPYLDPSLSLASLADLVQTTPHVLSRVINEQTQTNFFDFINTYRINAFKLLASDSKNQHLTLLAIAFQAGFNSKTAFNSAFRRLVGVSPKVYLKENNYFIKDSKSIQ